MSDVPGLATPLAGATVVAVVLDELVEDSGDEVDDSDELDSDSEVDSGEDEAGVEASVEEDSVEEDSVEPSADGDVSTDEDVVDEAGELSSELAAELIGVDAGTATPPLELLPQAVRITARTAAEPNIDIRRTRPDEVRFPDIWCIRSPSFRLRPNDRKLPER
ncbi:hypothetical protein ABIB25_000306 [Nakamurella sp. UYEF19]|uniref:hypothetical protein n=1 Tax=Nakamurella sp. UYEF19 TaxID=1756392 RepID=UPI0033996D37